MKGSGDARADYLLCHDERRSYGEPVTGGHEDHQVESLRPTGRKRQPVDAYVCRLRRYLRRGNRIVVIPDSARYYPGTGRI
jgi:hypothetical protein